MLIFVVSHHCKFWVLHILELFLNFNTSVFKPRGVKNFIPSLNHNNKNGTLKTRKGKALPICQSSFCISLISNSISLVILWENIGPDISIVCYYCLWVIQYPTWDYEYLLVLVKLKNFQIDFVPNFWSKYSIFK